MATEYKLSYTAEEIDERLGMVNDINEVLKTVEQTIPTIDNTLTLENHAADAKAVGERIAEVGQEFEEQLGQYTKPTKASYNLFDKYNADIKNYYIRQSDNLVVEKDYSKAIILKHPASVGDTFLFNFWKSATELGVAGVELFTFSEYPQVNGYATAFTKNGVESQYGWGRPTIPIDAEYLVLNIKWSSTTTAAETDELMAQVIDNLVVVCGSDVGTYDDYPYVEERILKVEEKNLSDEILEKLNGADTEETGMTENVIQTIQEITLRVGENLLTETTEVTLGTGWSGNLTDGFTHTAGNTEPLVFNIGAMDGESYIIGKDFTNPKDSEVYYQIGDSFPTDPYQGLGYKYWGVKCVGDNGSLSIIPINTFSGTITNLVCKKITEDGTETIEIPFDFIGLEVPEDKISGFYDMGLGVNTLTKSVNTTRNLAIGSQALKELVTGGRNIGLGTFALADLEYGENNISIGADSCFEIKQAKDCIALGKAVMHYGAKRENDIAIGARALYGYGAENTETSKLNIGIGKDAGYSNASSGCVFIGANAGYRTNNYQNTFIGYDAGKDVTTGSRNTCIGAGSKCSPTISRSTAIGHQAEATKSLQTVIGGSYTTETLIYGNLVVSGTDGVKRQIVFNTDGTCSWTTVE